MWSGLWWAKNFFGGLFWGPPSGAVPPVVVVEGEHGAWQPKRGAKKKKERQPNPYDRDPIAVRASLMAVVNAAEQRRAAAAFAEMDRQDEEDLMILLQRFQLS